MSQQTQRYARYHGQTYRLLFLGPTPFGFKAKLAYRDGTKVFWVNGRLVTEQTGYMDSISDSHRRRSGRAGCSCSCQRGGGDACFECQQDECPE